MVVLASRATYATKQNGDFDTSYVQNQHTTTNQVMNDIMNLQLSNNSIRSSPECWMTSISTIGRWGINAKQDDEQQNLQLIQHTSGSSYCAAMTTEQQEVLALELTNCQLMRENEPLYDTSRKMDTVEASVDTCLVGEGSSIPYVTSSCLPLMSQYARRLYHSILLHTNDICNRLTEEHLMLQKEEVTQMLVYATSAVSNQMQNILEDMKVQQQESERLHKTRDKAAAQTIEQMTIQTASFLQEHAEKLKSQQSAYLEEQTSIMKVQQLEREKIAASSLEQMTIQTESFLLAHAEKMKSQQNALINEQADKIKDLQEVSYWGVVIIIAQLYTCLLNLLLFYIQMITSANSQMQPLSSIETYVKLATNGFNILKSFLNFFLWMNVAWMVTTVPLLTSVKRYLYGVFTMGLLAEVLVTWFVEDAKFMMGVEDVESAIELVRMWTRVSAMAVLLLSPIVLFFYPNMKDTSTVTMDELLRSQMDFVSKLNETAQVDTRHERYIVPSSAVKYTVKPEAEVKFNEERGRSKDRMRQDSVMISNNKPSRRRQSISSRHLSGSLTELALPVVTPLVRPSSQRTASNDILCTAQQQTQVQLYDHQPGVYYVHRSDVIAREEEEANHLEMECLRGLYRKSASSIASSAEASCGSTVISSIEGSCPKRNKKKRSLSDVYASSGDESEFFSANEEEMSVSSTASAQVGKKIRLASEPLLDSVPEEVHIS